MLTQFAMGRLDASRLEGLFLDLREAMSRNPVVPSSFFFTTDEETARLTEHLTAIVRAIGTYDLNSRLATAFVGQHDVDGASRLQVFIEQLHGSWRTFLAEQLPAEKVAVLRALLAKPFPDFLTLLGKQDGENAHSDVLRWLFDPRTAPVVAPAALAALVSKLEKPDDWRSRLAASIQEGSISVRREVPLGRELENPDALDRVDLVVSGRGFRIAIENKIWSDEHDLQTETYWGWLERFPGAERRACFFLSPSGALASCGSVKSISYMELLGILLEGPLSATLSSEEECVLCGYVKALAVSVLRRQLRGIREGRIHE